MQFLVGAQAGIRKGCREESRFNIHSGSPNTWLRAGLATEGPSPPTPRPQRTSSNPVP